MKKMLLTLTLLVLSSAATFAGHRDSDLKLTVFQNQQFLMNLDGYRYTRPAEQVILRDLEPGRHFLEVYSACGTRMLFRGYIHLQPSSQIKAKIDSRGQFIISHVVLKGGTVNYGPPANGTVIYTGHSTGYYAGGSCAGPPQPFGVYTGHSANSVAIPLCAPVAFQSLIRSLQAQRFDEARLSILRDAVRHNVFTSAQLRDLACTMTFEAARLDAAKIGYTALVDPQNVYLVTEAFRFSGSTAEFYAWIG